ncbi:MAG TPA: pyridoxamine 5'-phosphate oxidase family protein, partial [Polyangia bacterium]
EPDGSLRARPMDLMRDALPDCDLWFVTADDTHKTDEIDRHHVVDVCCLRTRDRAYLSLSARARVERNPGEVRRLWQPTWKLWLGDERPEDGGIVLLKLDVERAEYWEPEGGRLRVIYAREPAERAEDQEGIDIDL